MPKKERTYIAIDLKSFYASVECVERGLDPLTTNLVVADLSRTEKTICLAVTPSLKSYGISGRARLFEVVRDVRTLNLRRLQKAPGRKFSGSSSDKRALDADPSLEITYEVAKPRMALYMEYSSRIYQIYLKYIAPEDIHVYSVDEVFMDVTDYLDTYGLTPHELAIKMIRDVLKNTGITATAGIGTNLYLAKIAMDIVAKKMPADKDGVRIAELNEISYRRQLWDHTPITDFWRIGSGYRRRLESVGLYTMGDIARCSLGRPGEYHNPDLLFDLFGINAELLIDHAWGVEPCTIKDIKSYVPENNSISSGQVLQEPYPFDKAKLVVREMTESLVLDLVKKDLLTDQMVLTVGYDIENLSGGKQDSFEVDTDRYGRKVPKSAHGSINLKRKTSSTKLIVEAVMELFDSIVNERLLVRRMYVVANHVTAGEEKIEQPKYEQLDLFTDYEARDASVQKEEAALEKEKKMQKAILALQEKFGKNAVLKGMNLQEGATANERNAMIGGHKA
ncbi:MAG: DNA methylase [Lachnospiraceae bacterium]|nr:DNA methylase [Lachnospiraceae bacterium]